jgi:hypothetical protein
MLKPSKILSESENSRSSLKVTSTVKLIPEIPEDGLNPSSIIEAKNNTNSLIPSAIVLKTDKNNDLEENQIKQNKTLIFSESYIQEKIPGYSTFYYKEVISFLKELDYSINDENKKQNLDKFQNLGIGIQEKINKINSFLEFIPKESFNELKEIYKEKISLFSFFKKINDEFKEFNMEAKKTHQILKKKLIQMKNEKKRIFDDFNRLYFYYDFFKFIIEEIKNKEILSKDELIYSPIINRLTSISNSITIFEQFKSIYEIEINSKEMELNSLEDYLLNIKPSLKLLLYQDKKNFKKAFKAFIYNL